MTRRSLLIGGVAVLVVALVAAGVIAWRSGVFGHRIAGSATATVTVPVGPAGATASAGGVEVTVPAGAVRRPTTLVLHPAVAAEPPALAGITRPLGGGIALAFGDRSQPRRPVRVAVSVPGPPARGFAPVLFTEPSGGGAPHLIPARYVVDRKRLVGELDHFSSIFGFQLDLAGWGRGLLASMAPFLSAATRPDCAGRPAKLGEETVHIGGNYGAGTVPVAWPCVSVDNDGLRVELTANARIPYRVDVPPGWPEPSLASLDVHASVVQRLAQMLPRSSARFRDLLMPDMSMAYRLEPGQLPATLRGSIDPGPYLGLIMVWAIHSAMQLFGVHIEALDKLEGSVSLLGCAADAGSAAFAKPRQFTERLADTLRATWSCVTAVAGQLAGPAGLVIGLLTGGIPLIFAGLEGVVRQFTASTFAIPLTVTQPAVTLDVFSRDWVGHTRLLKIDAAGRATESISEGCCDPLIDLTFQLSDPRGTPDNATATMTVTSVSLHDWPAGEPIPTVGQTETIRLSDGVLSEPATGTEYCNEAAGARGVCGA